MFIEPAKYKRLKLVDHVDRTGETVNFVKACYLAILSMVKIIFLM